MEVDFVNCPCELLQMEIKDIMGTNHDNVFTNNLYPHIHKYDLDQYQQVLGVHQPQQQ